VQSDDPSNAPSPPAALEARVLGALRQVIDPEVGLNIVDLGLVYGVDVEGDRVLVRLTMTTPACPLGEAISLDAQAHVSALEGVREAAIELVWEPPWTPERMSPAAKEELGWSA
jgi:metal-sulfur cluster biosynthetic enzyme